MSQSLKAKPRVVPPLRPGPKGGKRDVNRHRRTQEISAAALQLFLQSGIEGVTIDDIVRAAGIAKGSFYRYFRDKGDLVEAIFGPYLEQVGAAFGKARETMRAAQQKDELFAAYRVLSESLAEMIFHSPDTFVLYLQENRAPPIGARKVVGDLSAMIDRYSIELTEVAIARGLLRPVEARITARAVVGAVEKLMHSVLSGQEMGEPLMIPEVLIGMILNGIQA